MKQDNSLKIIELKPDYYEAYEAFIDENKGFLWYSSMAYLLFFKEYLKANDRYLIALIKDKIVGCLPLFSFSDKKYGQILNSLPYYGSTGGLLIDKRLSTDKAIFISDKLFDELEKIIKSENVAGLTVITSPFDTFSKNYLEEYFSADFKDFRIGQLTPLPKNHDDLMSVFQSPRPRNIRKALKSNIKVRTSTLQDDFNFLEETHQENIKTIGGKFKDSNFFNLVRQGKAKETFKLYIAEYEGQRVAALLLFYFNETVEYFTPCTLGEYRNLQPSSLLIYEAMKDAINSQYRFWNWGGTWESQYGVYDFKKRWGAVDKKYHYFTKIFNKQLLELSQHEIEVAYPNFYTLPFKYLKK